MICYSSVSKWLLEIEIFLVSLYILDFFSFLQRRRLLLSSLRF